MLSVSLLGPPSLLLDGEPLHVLRRKARAVLYYLAAHRGPVGRQNVLAVLWPEFDRPAAQHSLRATLHELRRALGDRLAVDTDALAITDAVVDARLFEQRLSPPVSDAKLLAETLRFYRGDFLDGFSVSDAPEFDVWVARERERYRRLAIDGLAILASEREETGDFIRALSCLNQALDLDPWREDLQRTCLRLHYLSGDRAGAIRRYEKLRKMLRKEMAVPPLPETRLLYDAIITDSLARDDQSRVVLRRYDDGSSLSLPNVEAKRLPFVGRDAELRRLHVLTARKPGQLALIEGEAGIGKTRLIEELISQSGALPLRGSAHELEQILPYQPIVEALRGLLSLPEWPSLEGTLHANLAPVWCVEIARLLPEMTLQTAGGVVAETAFGERRLWEAISQLLLTLSRQRQVIVFLDDLHWADASTLGMLSYLIRQITTQPIAFLAAARPFPAQSALNQLIQALRRDGRLSSVTLGRLAHGDVVSIADQLTAKDGNVLGAWLASCSEGNPYILAELIRHARENGILRADGSVDVGRLPATPIVPQIQSLIQARLERLSETALRGLEVAAVIGREFEYEVVASAGGISERTAVEAFDELRAAGLIRPLDGLRWSFDHSLVVEFVRHEISEPRRRLLHRLVAEALAGIHNERLDAVAGLVAWHFGEAGLPERAAPYALNAGNRARRMAAWTEAIAFYESALMAFQGPERVSALRALGAAYLYAGQAGRGAVVLREASVLTGSDQGAALMEFLSGMAMLIERPEFGEFLWGSEPIFHVSNLDDIAGHFKAAEALSEGNTALDWPARVATKIALGQIAAMDGDLPGAISSFRTALAVAEQSPQRAATSHAVILAHANLANYLRLSNDRRAIDHARSGLRASQEGGWLACQPYILSVLGQVAFANGDLREAQQHCDEGLLLAERQSTQYPVVSLMATLARIDDERGDKAMAIERLSAALRHAESLGLRNQATRMRLWLIPLLASTEAHVRLEELRRDAENGGRPSLLAEIARLECSC